jgi:hypothetical protein
LNSSTDTQKQHGSIVENINENLAENEVDGKSGKSNSELMAEFFSISPDSEKE